MKKFWLAPCFALGVALYAGTAQAAYWQVIRDTPVRTDAAADAKVLGTARKGWIVSDMTGVGSGPQWIKMVEFETKPGEGMAYAYLVFNSPDAYVSAADVVQVHEDGMFQQQTESIQSEQGQGVHIHHLPAPQTDDATLKTALESWVQECNAVLSTYQAMAPDKAAEAIMAWEDESPFPDKSIEAVQNSAEPLLNRWINSLYALPKVPLSADDKKMLGVLADYGLLPQMAEGIPFLTVDMNVLRKRISFEPPMVAYTAFRALLDSQPTVLFADGGCLYSVKEMGTWAVQWEHYLKTVPADSVYFREGKKRYLAFITYSLLSDLPNTPAFPGYNKGRMEKEWVASLKYVASENPGTQTAALITEFLGNIKASDNKLSPSYETTLLRKLALPSFPETK